MEMHSIIHDERNLLKRYKACCFDSFKQFTKTILFFTGVTSALEVSLTQCATFSTSTDLLS